MVDRTLGIEQAVFPNKEESLGQSFIEKIGLITAELLGDSRVLSEVETPANLFNFRAVASYKNLNLATRSEICCHFLNKSSLSSATSDDIPDADDGDRNFFLLKPALVESEVAQFNARFKERTQCEECTLYKGATSSPFDHICDVGCHVH